MKANNLSNLLSPAAMAQLPDNTGAYEVNKHPRITYLSAITAGIFISIAFVFYITVTTGIASVPFGLSKLAVGLCFLLGLMLVIVCGADLFTSSVLTIVAKATGKVSWKQMFVNWFNVYIGNLIGALFFVALIWFAGQYMVANGQWGLNVLQTANHKLDHTFLEAICLGILANLMVCLGVWMSYSGRSLLDKIFVLILPIGMFVASGFEHSIANMFMIPLGIVIKNFASPDFWLMTGVNENQFSHLTVANFITDNLIPVTIGNIIGGALLVGMTYWLIYLRDGCQH